MLHFLFNNRLHWVILEGETPLSLLSLNLRLLCLLSEPFLFPLHTSPVIGIHSLVEVIQIFTRVVNQLQDLIKRVQDLLKTDILTEVVPIDWSCGEYLLELVQCNFLLLCIHMLEGAKQVPHLLLLHLLGPDFDDPVEHDVFQDVLKADDLLLLFPLLHVVWHIHDVVQRVLLVQLQDVVRIHVHHAGKVRVVRLDLRQALDR